MKTTVLCLLSAIGVTCLAEPPMTAEQAVALVREQFAFDTLYVETDILWTTIDNGQTCQRTVHFGIQGDDCYFGFINDAPQVRESIQKNSARTAVTVEKEIAESVQRNGAFRKRSRNYIAGQASPSEAGYEDAAAEGDVYGIWATPDTVMGLFGTEARDQLTSTHGIRMKAFLDSPGPFRVSSVDGATVLSHEAAYNSGVADKKVSADIWINANGDVFKIEEVNRPWDVDDATIAKYHKGDWFSMRSVNLCVDRSDFAVDKTGKVKYPRKAVVTSYGLTSEHIRFLQEGRVSMPRDEFMVKRLQFAKFPEFRFELAATLATINEPLPSGLLDLTFPENTVVYSDAQLQVHHVAVPPSPWYVRNRLALLIGACLLAVVATAFVGRRWLGWRA